MLYPFHEWQRAALQPWQAFAKVANEFYGHGLSPFSRFPNDRQMESGI